MFRNLTQKLLKGWTLLRFLRLALAFIALSEAWANNDVLLGMIGTVLLIQAGLNVGCCGADGCDINHLKTKPVSVQTGIEITNFKEIK